MIEKIEQPQFPLRTEIENDVMAFNKFLKPVVRFMPLYELLCNCHPLYRAGYARRLKSEGYCTDNQVKEFKTKNLIETL